MKKTKTRDELLQEVAELQYRNEQLVLQDQIRRKEFAKAFSWYKLQQPYHHRNESEPQCPSWEQVWVNIGFLTAQRDFRDYEGNINELEVKLEALEDKIRKEVHHNLRD